MVRGRELEGFGSGEGVNRRGGRWEAITLSRLAVGS